MQQNTKEYNTVQSLNSLKIKSATLQSNTIYYNPLLNLEISICPSLFSKTKPFPDLSNGLLYFFLTFFKINLCFNF